MRNSYLSTLCLCISIVALFLCLSQCQHMNKAGSEGLPAAVGIGDARTVLRHFAHGSVPNYSAMPAGFVSPASEVLSQPDYCFARCDLEEAGGEDLYASFQANTEAFLVPVAKGIRKLELTEHSFVDEDQTVERWMYGNHWMVIVNFGDSDYLYQSTLLPPHGFIAVGPHFLTQHYYAHADDKKTMLFVQQDGEKRVIY